MSLLKKVFRRLKLYWVNYIKTQKWEAKVLYSLETIRYIINNRVSVCRYGDGELALMEGKDIGFQCANNELALDLKNIKSNENKLICIPKVFTVRDRRFLNKNAKKFWKTTMLFKCQSWYECFNKGLYGDSLFTRFYIDIKNKSQVENYVKELKRIWDKKNIVFIEGEQSRLGVGNNLFDNTSSVKRILCPSINAYKKKNEIIEYVKESIEKSTLIIIALGPTATIMASELSDLGYQALDLGHIDVEYEWYKMGATKKVPIINKFVNEAENGNNVEKCNDIDYHESIIKIFQESNIKS